MKEQNPKEEKEEDWVETEDSTGEVNNKMPRPCKRRRIRGNPQSNYFKPAGILIRELKETELEISEFEAIRLVDFQEISQEEAAKQMQISQPTLSRTLASARKKIADSIINGKAIKISKDLN